MVRTSQFQPENSAYREQLGMRKDPTEFIQ
jgi:hypothetical protein